GLDEDEVLAVVAEQAESALVTVDDEQLADADLAVKRHLLFRIIARALNLHQEVRAAEQVSPASDRPTVLEGGDDVRGSVAFFPVGSPVADVGAGIHLTPAGQADDLDQDHR